MVYIYIVFWMILSDGHEQKFSQQTNRDSFLNIHLCISAFSFLISELFWKKNPPKPGFSYIISFLKWSTFPYTIPKHITPIPSPSPNIPESITIHHPQPPRNRFPSHPTGGSKRSVSTLAVHFRQVLQHLPRSMVFFNAPIFSAEQGGRHGSSGKKRHLKQCGWGEMCDFW